MPERKKSTIRQIDVAFETLTLPPPYSYAYTFQLQFEAGRLSLDYDLRYTDRDELSEEEIWDEGFTPDDDYQWHGFLPKVWYDTLLQHWSATDWLALEETESTSENVLIVTTTFMDGSQQQGVPQSPDRWEYLLQELTQAVYEAGQREHPLRIRYLDRQGSVEKIVIDLKASFLHRSLEAEIKEGRHRQRRALPWSGLEPLLSMMYVLDYQSSSSGKHSRHPGRYLDPGDGQWYALGKQVTNPGNRDYLDELNALFYRLLKG
jgi:hypothetical protein